MSSQEIAAAVAYVFQNPDSQIFAATVLDEVAFGPRNLGLTADEVADRAAQALRAVGLADRDAHDPFTLSKGDRQRLAVASVLALHPRLIVLDEPTTGLDYRQQLEMMAFLAELRAEGMAIVAITHSPWLASDYAARGVLLRGGRIAYDGPLEELMGQEELLTAAHFVAPEVVRLAHRLGFRAASLRAFEAHLRTTTARGAEHVD